MVSPCLCFPSFLNKRALSPTLPPSSLILVAQSFLRFPALSLRVTGGREVWVIENLVLKASC